MSDGREELRYVVPEPDYMHRTAVSAESIVEALGRCKALCAGEQTMYWRCRPEYVQARFYARTFAALGVEFEEAPPRQDWLFEVGWIHHREAFRDAVITVIPMRGVDGPMIARELT